MAAPLAGPGWEFPAARLLDAHDGDTVKVAISLGFDIWAHVWVRLVGVRAPELNEPDGPAARQDVLDWWAENAPDGLVKVTTYRTVTPLEIRLRQSFTRYLGRIVAASNAVELNAWLVARGYIDRGMST